MIAVDTSALMAIVLGQAEADACIKVLKAETEVLVSAGTVAEALILPPSGTSARKWHT